MENFSNDDLMILSEGLILLIQEESTAMEKLPTIRVLDETRNQIKKNIAYLVELNRKICGMMEDE